LANAVAFVEDALITGRGPEIKFECAVEPGIVLGGNWAWERVLINLFLNAMRAMPAGGTIGVRARRTGDVNEIVVSDEGSGIPTEILEHLFHPHVSTNGSSGLGLHIVETVVEQNGGQVRAANRPGGVGAEFTITLPARPQARPASAG
jgi:two-component system sensor histidine kinase HydH